MPPLNTGQPNGRPRKPTALKVLHGEIKPGQVREPRPRGNVEIPGDLTPQARAIWELIGPALIDSGMLTVVDVPLFAEFCEAMVLVKLARLRVVQEATGRLEVKPGSPAPINSYVRSLLVAASIGGRFGLMPSDRARLIAAGEERADEPSASRYFS
jgi:phage terminase small subunit